MYSLISICSVYIATNERIYVHRFSKPRPRLDPSDTTASQKKQCQTALSRFHRVNEDTHLSPLYGCPYGLRQLTCGASGNRFHKKKELRSNQRGLILVDKLN